MNFRQLAWTGATAAFLGLSALPAHAERQDYIDQIVAARKDGTEATASEIVLQPVRQIYEVARRALVAFVPEDKREAVNKQIEDELKKYADSAVPAFKTSADNLAPSAVNEALKDKFSDDEVKQLAGMLQSPVLKRYIAATAEINNALFQKVLADTSPQLNPKLKELQASVTKILDSASGGKFSAAVAANSAGASAPAGATGTGKKKK